MLKIKDYLMLKKIYQYLSVMRDEEIKLNNGFANKITEDLKEMIRGLDKIIYTLEKSDN